MERMAKSINTSEKLTIVSSFPVVHRRHAIAIQQLDCSLQTSYSAQSHLTILLLHIYQPKRPILQQLLQLLRLHDHSRQDRRRLRVRHIGTDLVLTSRRLIEAAIRLEDLNRLVIHLVEHLSREDHDRD